jgi:hypothetical protein
MTVLTMPVQPGRDNGTEPGPVPWQGMLWVTWRLLGRGVSRGR